MKIRIFSVCAPQLSGCTLFAPPPPDARAIFIHNDFLYNDTSSLTGGAYRTGGGGGGGGGRGHKRKRSGNCHEKHLTSAKVLEGPSRIFSFLRLH